MPEKYYDPSRISTTATSVKEYDPSRAPTFACQRIWSNLGTFIWLTVKEHDPSWVLFSGSLINSDNTNLILI